MRVINLGGIHKSIFIKPPIYRCFEEKNETLAVTVGETKANVEQTQETVKEVEQKTEELEQNQRWTDERISNAFEQLWGLESRVSELEIQLAELQNASIEVEEVKETTETTETTETSEETTKLEAHETPKEETKKKKKYSFLF